MGISCFIHLLDFFLFFFFFYKKRKNTVKSTAIFKSFVAHRENGGGSSLLHQNVPECDPPHSAAPGMFGMTTRWGKMITIEVLVKHNPQKNAANIEETLVSGTYSYS